MERPERLTPAQLREKISGKENWIMAYNEILLLWDKHAQRAVLMEDYPPAGGWWSESWREIHFPRTSPIVESSRREGTKTIYTIRPGKEDVKLEPAFSPIGIESLDVDTAKDEARITYVGLGGGGVSASYSRGLAKGVTGVEIYSEGGGRSLGKSAVIVPIHRPLLISVDDTDNDECGATYCLVQNIADKAAKKENVRCITHVNAQLYPYTPSKTRNCFSTAVGFISRGDAGLEERIIDYFRKELKESTFSNNTAMCSYDGFIIPGELEAFGERAKNELIDFQGEEKQNIFDLAKRNNVGVHVITGERGVIGALAAIGLHNEPYYAAQLPRGMIYKNI